MRISAIQGQILPRPRLIKKNPQMVSHPKFNQNSSTFKGAEGLIKGGYWGAVLGGLGGVAIMASGVGIPVALTYFGSVIGGALAGGTIGHRISGPDSED